MTCPNCPGPRVPHRCGLKGGDLASSIAALAADFNMSSGGRGGGARGRGGVMPPPQRPRVPDASPTAAPWAKGAVSNDQGKGVHGKDVAQPRTDLTPERTSEASVVNEVEEVEDQESPPKFVVGEAPPPQRRSAVPAWSPSLRHQSKAAQTPILSSPRAKASSAKAASPSTDTDDHCASSDAGSQDSLVSRDGAQRATSDVSSGSSVAALELVEVSVDTINVALKALVQWLLSEEGGDPVPPEPADTALREVANNVSGEIQANWCETRETTAIQAAASQAFDSPDEVIAAWSLDDLSVCWFSEERRQDLRDRYILEPGQTVTAGSSLLLLCQTSFPSGGQCLLACSLPLGTLRQGLEVDEGTAPPAVCIAFACPPSIRPLFGLAPRGYRRERRNMEPAPVWEALLEPVLPV